MKTYRLRAFRDKELSVLLRDVADWLEQSRVIVETIHIDDGRTAYVVNVYYRHRPRPLFSTDLSHLPPITNGQALTLHTTQVWDDGRLVDFTVETPES